MDYGFAVPMLPYIFSNCSMLQSTVLLLDPDISKVFKDSESVNHALRMLIELADKETKRNITK